MYPLQLENKFFLEAKSSITKDGLLKKVHLVGLNSVNKHNGKPYTYAEIALKEAVDLYTNADVYINHIDPKVTPKVEDKIGFVKSAYFEEGVGIVGDVQLNTEHELYKSIYWWAENAPKKLGFSHVIGGAIDTTRNQITKISAVRSVDLVYEGATTNGLFTEGVITDLVNADNGRRSFNDTISKAYSMLMDIVYPLGQGLTDVEKSIKCTPVIEDMLATVKAYNPDNNAQAAAAAGTLEPTINNPSTTSTTSTESKQMEIKDLTKELLTSDRPDLVKIIATEAVAAHKQLELKVSESVKDVPEDLKTEVFVGQIREHLEAGKDIAYLVEDRKSLATKLTSIQSSRSTGRTEEVVKTEGKKVSLTDEQVLAAVKRS